MKNLTLFALLLISTNVRAEVEPISHPSPNTGTITPTEITAVTGSFSGSLTASSGTFNGGGGVGVTYGVNAATYQATGGNGYGLGINPGTTQGMSASGGHLLLRANTGSTVYVQNAAGTTFASFDATRTTLPLDLSVTGSVGIGTASPCSTCTLHVAGGASVTGAFAVASATFTVATTGIVSAPSQPYVRVPVGTNILTNGVSSKLYFAAPTAGDSIGGMWGGTSSSGTFTVPAGGGGSYSLTLNHYATATNLGGWFVDFKVNGSAPVGCHWLVQAGTDGHSCPYTIRLSAGDTVEVWVTQNGTVDYVPNTNGVYSNFSMVKIW